jgi:proline racemase
LLLSCKVQTGPHPAQQASPSAGSTIYRVTRQYRTIDAHVGGQPLRLIVDGMPRIGGKTALQKGEWLRRHADTIRRALVLEPRGHAGMVAAVLIEAASPQAQAGLVFMDGDGYPTMSGHGVIAAATVAIERRLLRNGAEPFRETLRNGAEPFRETLRNGAEPFRETGFSRDDDLGDIRVVFETAAGDVHVRARAEMRGGERRVHSVAFANVPSFVHTAAHPVRIGTRELRVDVAFGGAFYAIADTEAIGIPLQIDRLPDLRRLGIQIRDSLNAATQVQHPSEARLAGIGGVVFTGPPEDPEAHLRSVTVAGSTLDRSPSGTGTAAVMAVLDAMGLLPEDQTFVHESLTGALFRGRAVRRTVVGDFPALIPEVEGAAWITGEHTFLVDEDDPLKDGFTF